MSLKKAIKRSRKKFSQHYKNVMQSNPISGSLYSLVANNVKGDYNITGESGPKPQGDGKPNSGENKNERGERERTEARAREVQGLYDTYIGEGGDPNDKVFLHYYNQARSGTSTETLATFEQLAMSKIGELKIQAGNKKLSGELFGGQGQLDDPSTPYDESQGMWGKVAYDTVKASNPLVQQELARLGILHGGAYQENINQINTQLAASAGQQKMQVAQGQQKDIQTLGTDNLTALINLRNQQRAQHLANQISQPKRKKLQGAMAGATAGAMIGNQIVPGWGAVGGGIIGGISGGIWG